MPHLSLLDRISVETLQYIDFPTHLSVSTPSPWAVILVKFSDDPATNPDLAIYENLFTSAGNGTENVPTFFADMSHGRLDLSGSKVFGWYTLAQKRSAYVGNSAPSATQLDRGGLLNAARAVATAAGVDLALFSGVVVSAYGSTDLCGWVGGMAALCDQHSLQPSLLGQEMGHGYGLDHARKQGSTDDYQDPWDIMSTAAWPWMEEPDSDYTDIGPGLNAWCMRSRGWLDENRVWKATGAYDQTITLRPLHRRDLPGYLAAELGNDLVELRVPESWDAAIGAPTVLVHRFEDNHSYLMPGDDGEQSLSVGSTLTLGQPDYAYLPFYKVTVTAIHPQENTATVRLQYRPPAPIPQPPGLVGRVYGPVEVDGGGFIVLAGGKIVPVPPRGPVTELVAQLATLAGSELTGDIALGLAQRRSTLRSVITTAQGLLEENDLVSSSPPKFAVKGRSQQD